jgi:uncharacterized membrane protein
MGNYNAIAGWSLERLGALSDGVFAFAMTLLVLDLMSVQMIFGGQRHIGEQTLEANLFAMWRYFIPWLMSFMTLGIFWVGQQTQLNAFERSDRDLTWIHIGFLCVISLIPFTTKLLNSFTYSRLALILYWFIIFLAGVGLYVSLAYANRAGLIKKGHEELVQFGRRRILIAQSLYALAALMCIVNPYWSIALIVLIQLNYVIAPRVGFLRDI